MNSKFKKNQKVFVYGPGGNAGFFYKNIPAIIIERDSYYKDYLVKFKDGTEDWISPQNLRKPFERKQKKHRKRNSKKKKRRS